MCPLAKVPARSPRFRGMTLRGPVSEPDPDATSASPRELLAFWALSLAAIAWIAPRGPLYWDSFAYVSQAITGKVGGLGLGRPLFVLLSHGVAALALALGAKVTALEPLLRALWSAASAVSAPLTVLIAASLSLPAAARRWAGLFVALSPAMAHASGQVLTDGPSVTAALACTALALRAKNGDGAREALLWLGAGACLGAAFVLRESTLSHALVLYGLISLGPKGSRSRAVVTASTGVILVAGLCLAWAARQPGWSETVRAWARAMAAERRAHAYGWRDALAYAGWLVALAPAAILPAAIGWSRVRREVLARGPAFAVVTAGALLPLLALGAYQDIAFSPRYLLGSLPGAVALVAAVVAAERARSRARAAVLAGLSLAVALGAGAVLRHRERATRSAIDTVGERLQSLAPDTVIVTGQACPAIELSRALARANGDGAYARWTLVCPGWGWPARLDRALDAHRASGRTVVIDLREGVWLGARQQAARAEAAAWLATAGPDVVRWP
jgi:4-amino-4-deoxy-L-arabinose transferase-like glycosyltransferase